MECQSAKLADLLKAKLNLYQAKEKSSRVLPKLQARTRWFCALILDPTQKLIRQLLLGKPWDNILNKFNSTLLVNGTLSASFMTEKT